MNVRIEKIEITSFGKLKNTVVDLAGGINILCAPNESGKSTLAAFIKFVFYGFAGQRLQSISENEKKLYTPWDGEISEGAVAIECDEGRFVIERRVTASGRETVSITDRRTGNSVHSGEIPGEVFFGVSEDIFSRTLFFRQLTTPQGKDELLAERLRNIAISADERIGTGKAVERLTQARNELKNRLGNGLIPRLTSQRNELNAEISESEAFRAECTRLSAEIAAKRAIVEETAQNLSELAAERNNIEKYEALLRLREIRRIAGERQQAEAEYDEARAAIKKDSDTAGSEIGMLYEMNARLVAEKSRLESLRSASKEASDDLEAANAALPFDDDAAEDARATIASSAVTARILAVLTGLAVVAGLVLVLAFRSGAGYACIGAAAVCAAVAGVFVAKPSAKAKELGIADAAALRAALAAYPAAKERKALAEERLSASTSREGDCRAECAALERRLSEEIGGYVDSSGGNYSQILETIKRASDNIGEKLAVLNSKKDAFSAATAGVDIEVLAELAAGAVKPERERTLVDRETAFYTQKHDNNAELLRNAELSYASNEARGGDAALMVSRRDALSAEIESLSAKHAAYGIAIEMINESSEYMKSMVAPRIGARADEYFSAATGGKYSGFEVDTKLSMSYGDDFRRSAEYLSAGTRDSAYLCLRFALADMLFGGCGVPIVLDDAFVRIDDSRLRMMAGALCMAAQRHQIIILTHSEREREALADIGAESTDISLRTAGAK